MYQQARASNPADGDICEAVRMAQWQRDHFYVAHRRFFTETSLDCHTMQHRFGDDRFLSVIPLQQISDEAQIHAVEPALGQMVPASKFQFDKVLRRESHGMQEFLVCCSGAIEKEQFVKFLNGNCFGLLF